MWTMAQELDTSLIIPLPKKVTHDFVRTTERTINLISHSSKVMLWVNLNRLVNQAEQILEEKFRSRRSTTEQIFNLRLLVEKHLTPEELFHYFINFKKPFDCVWQDRGLLTSLKRIQHRQPSDLSHQVIRWNDQRCVIKWKCRRLLSNDGGSTLRMSIISSTI